MADPDFEHLDGFDKYGPAGNSLMATQNSGLLSSEYTSFAVGSGGFIRIAAPLNGAVPGHGSVEMFAATTGGGVTHLTKNLPVNQARSIGGFTIAIAAIYNNAGIVFLDAANHQLNLVINTTTGKIEVWRGNFVTLLAASTEIMANGTTHVIEWDITFDNAAGIIKVWLDGILTSINLTAQDTCATANNYITAFSLRARQGNDFQAKFDHFYYWGYTAAGGSETPALTNPIIETSAPTSDGPTTDFSNVNHAIQTLNFFWPSTAVAHALGANVSFIRKIAVDVAGNITGLTIQAPNTTSAVSKHKMVVYADSAGAPGALLATGTESIGQTIGTPKSLVLAAPLAVTPGDYWIGWMSDIATSWFGSSGVGAGAGYLKANTYASGATNPYGALSTVNAGNLNFTVTMTGITPNYVQHNASPPLGKDLGYNESVTVNHLDLFGFPALSTTPLAIHSVAVKGMLARSDSGVRTTRFAVRSAGVNSTGSSADISPSLTWAMEGANFKIDPATGLPWTAAGLAAATFGIKVTL